MLTYPVCETCREPVLKRHIRQLYGEERYYAEVRTAMNQAKETLEAHKRTLKPSQYEDIIVLFSKIEDCDEPPHVSQAENCELFNCTRLIYS